MGENDDESMNKPFYLDEKNFMAEFLLKPEINDDADFNHIDKNLSVTRLASRFKEPEQARHILRALHVLNNQKYFRDFVVKEKTGETQLVDKYFYKCPICGTEAVHDDNQEAECCGNTITPEHIQQEVPVYEKTIKRKSIFPRAYHGLKAKFYALTTTSMARDGHLMRSATTTHFSKSETVEDRTGVKKNPFNFVSKNKRQE